MVRIVGAPSNAKLWVDGAPVENPFRLAPSSERHKLRVLAYGFRPYSTEFSATEDVAFTVRMIRDRGGSAPADAGTTRDSRSGQLDPNPFLDRPR